MDSTEFFGSDAAAADPQGYDRYGRYLLNADGKGDKAYTRATTLAKTLDSGEGLSVWKQRKAARGVALSPALTARAAATPLDDKAVWREILAQAEVKTEGDEKREWGSAFHEFHQRVPDMTDAEYAAQAVELRVTYERYRAELDRLGIEEVFTEFTCVNQQIGTAGKGDAVFKLADGRLVIGDRKTGRATEYPHAPAVQLAVYAHADTMIIYDKNGVATRHPMPELDTSIGIVVDITIGDEKTAAVHVYELDLMAGWYGALLAAKVRRWRLRKDLIMPYHPEFSPSEKVLAAAAVEPVRMKRVVTDNSGIDWVVPENATMAEVMDNVGPDAAMTMRTVPVEPWAPGDFAEQRREENQLTGQANPLADYPTIAPPAPLPPNQAWFEGQTPGQPQPVEPADRPDANTANTERLGGPMMQPPHAAHPITHQAWSSAQQRNITLNPDGTRADGLTGPQVSAVLQPEPEQAAMDAMRPGSFAAGMDAPDDAAALLAQYKTKAQLQTAAKSLGLTNLSRTRANLAKDMVAHPNWPAQRAALLGKTNVAMGIIAEGDQHEQDGTGPAAEVFSPVVTNAPGPVPPDPEPTVRTEYAGEDGYAGGEPYPEPTVPVPHPDNPSVQDGYAGGNPFRPAAAPAPVPVKTPEDELAERIATAGSQDEIADIWDQAVNVVGIGWTPRLHQAATIRTKQFNQEG